MSSQFLRKDTRKSIVFMSVFAAIVVVALIMLGVLIQHEALLKSFMLFGISIFCLFVMSIWNGILEIHIFNDYKGQTKSLCAEGIFNIVLTVLVAISFVLFSTTQVSQVIDGETLSMVDVRWFVGIFVSAFAVWKVFAVLNAFKTKRNNAWIEIIVGVLWLTLAIIIFVSIKTLTPAIGWVGVVVSLLLIASMTLYNLYTYIFHDANYLVTEEGLAILEKDNADRANRLNRLVAMQNGGFAYAQPVAQQPVQEKVEKESAEDKLKKLEELKEKGVITEEEYAEKRKKIIDSL